MSLKVWHTCLKNDQIYYKESTSINILPYKNRINLYKISMWTQTNLIIENPNKSEDNRVLFDWKWESNNRNVQFEQFRIIESPSVCSYRVYCRSQAVRIEIEQTFKMAGTRNKRGRREQFNNSDRTLGNLWKQSLSNIKRIQILCRT